MPDASDSTGVKKTVFSEDLCYFFSQLQKEYDDL